MFVDPVGTGYSRAVGEGKRFWGVSEDLDSLASFIDRYLTVAGRRTSPKYLAGESYGGFRAASLPQVLAEDHSITVAGIFLISPVLEFSLIGDDDLALLPDVLRLPSYAAVHLEQSGTLEPSALAEVERFAHGSLSHRARRHAARRGGVARDLSRGGALHRRARGGDRPARRPRAARPVRQGGAARRTSC